MDLPAQMLDFVKSTFPDEFVGEGTHAKQPWIEIRKDRVVDVLTALKREGPFEMLMDLSCVDWLDQGKPERFSVVYVLYSLKHHAYFRVKAWVSEADPVLDSVFGVWPAASFAEREVFDLFGLVFAGHPNLKRILLPDSYTGYPLRKDYPVTGRGERYDFPKHTR